MDLDTIGRLRAIPAIRAEAERLAMEHAEAFSYERGAAALAQQPIYPWATTEDEHASVAAQLALLTDLSRPAAREALARMVAGAVGLDVSRGLTFDGAECVVSATSRDHVDTYMTLRGRRGATRHGGAYYTFCCPHYVEARTRHVVEGLCGVTDPTEALARVALAILTPTGDAP